MEIGEKLLLLMSRSPEAADYPIGQAERTVDNALNLLEEIFPDFDGMVRGKKIVDFGCGSGHHAVALAERGAQFVLGVDTNLNVLEDARRLAKTHGVEDRVSFTSSFRREDRKGFDVVLSINSMEHFARPEAVMDEMKALLGENGRILIKFEPPWFAPYGSHTYYFTKVPWVNIFFREKTVMAVRSRYRSDGATHYRDIEGGLNKMTVSRFERIAANCGMRMVFREYRSVMGLDIMGKLPLLRELFVNRISCVFSLESRSSVSVCV
ncbi:MAG: class I SAM-dependent methyltransferase [Pseudomonadota bacterium]